MTSVTPTNRPRTHRAASARGCGYHRRPARPSRWKRTPRTRGSLGTRPVIRLTATPRVSSRLALAMEAAAAGLMLVAGIATWGIALALLAF